MNLISHGWFRLGGSAGRLKLRSHTENSHAWLAETVVHHAVRRVIAAHGEQAFDDAPAAHGDPLDFRAATLDHQRLHASGVPVHDIKLHGLVLIVGDPVSAVQQQQPD